MGRTPFYRTSNWLEHWTNSNVFIYWWSNSNTLLMASNNQTSNFEPKGAFTRFTKLLIELTQTSFFWTSNELIRVHQLVIELEHPIFALNEWITNIERNKPFTRITKLLFELTQTSNELELVHLLVIELEHPILGFER